MTSLFIVREVRDMANIVKITTLHGANIEVDIEVMNNWKYTKNIGKLMSNKDEEQVVGLVNMVSLVFGKYEDAVVEAIEEKEGSCNTIFMQKELIDVFGKIKELKNSLSSQE